MVGDQNLSSRGVIYGSAVDWSKEQKQRAKEQWEPSAVWAVSCLENYQMDTWLLAACIMYDCLTKQSIKKTRNKTKKNNPKNQTLQKTIAVNFVEYFEMAKDFALRQNKSEVT